MKIDLQAKKEFLKWFISEEEFVQREVYWLVNYLLEHDAILRNVHFVEQGQETTRGLVIHTNAYDAPALSCYVQEQVLHDSEQIFHELRFNWQKPLYVTCVFPQSWQNERYLAVLEDNPYASWNTGIADETVDRVESYFSEEAYEQQVAALYQEIDAALQNGDQSLFLTLTEKLNALLAK